MSPYGLIEAFSHVNVVSEFITGQNYRLDIHGGTGGYRMGLKRAAR